MSRRTRTSLLTLGLMGSIGLSVMAPALADGFTIVDQTEVKRSIATKASIQAMLDKENLEEAEAGYLQWVNAWNEESTDLIIAVEGKILASQFASGNTDAFVASLLAGDADALNALRGMLQNGTCDLSGRQLTLAMQALGRYGTNDDLSIFTAIFQGKNAELVNAAIIGVGESHNPQALRPLCDLAAEADLTRSALIARTMVEMGATSLVSQRYKSQLKFPLEGMPERAAIMLSIAGNEDGWMKTSVLLANKTAPYYPLALSAIGKILDEQAKDYVTSGLAGDEQEKLAAIQSIAALPEEEIEPTLVGIITEQGNSQDLQLAALDQLAARYTESSGEALVNLVSNTEGVNGAVKAAAIQAMEQRDMLNVDGLRAMVRMQVLSADPQVAAAARGALLGYALKHRSLLF